MVFKLAGPPTQSKAAGRIMFFPHLATNHKGILNAMATEQAIPVQATFPDSASAVTLVLWGSTGCPALLEALDKNGEVVDKASVAAVPGRKAPGRSGPVFRADREGARRIGDSGHPIQRTARRRVPRRGRNPVHDRGDWKMRCLSKNGITKFWNRTASALVCVPLYCSKVLGIP